MTTDVTLDFRACDTTWRVGASGPHARRAAEAACVTVLALERRLNAFDPASVVSALRRDGCVRDQHVAALVRRAAEYRDRTRGVFDITRGALEHAVKAYIRGDEARLPAGADEVACVEVEGDVVRVRDGTLDLNGIAKGYIVDEAQATLVRHGVDGFVDGGGDIAGAIDVVGVESPGDPRTLLALLRTDWCIATSGKAKRRRGDVDHLYDARDGHVGARHEQVTVVAQRDCVEADVLATTLAVLSLDEGRALLRRWPGAEALWVSGGELVATRGFESHVHAS